jgi:H+/gluconate symporter-like permease
MLSLVGIIVGLGALMFAVMKGLSILVAAPLTMLIVAVSGGLPMLEAYMKHFMGGAGGYFVPWFPMFFLGALFGKVMDDVGAAASIAHWITSTLGKSREKAIIAIVVATAVLTYGGISLFVVVFTTYPLARALFRELDIPKRLIGGSIALGAFTFTMTAIPGTPQIQNIIPRSILALTQWQHL